MKKAAILLPVVLIITGLGALFLAAPTEDTFPSPTPPEDDFSAYTPGTPFRLYGGKADDGKKAFEALNCIQCHKVKGTKVAEPKSKRKLTLILGHEIRFVKRYEDLLLAITNPRHVINEQYRSILTQAELDGSIEPFMPDLTDHMSARQLVDIVTFLDSVYVKSQPDYQSPAR